MLPPARGAVGDGVGRNGLTMRQRVMCTPCGNTVGARLEAHPALIYRLCLVTRHELGAIRPLLTLEERTAALYEAFGRSLPSEALLRRTEDELKKEV